MFVVLIADLCPRAGERALGVEEDEDAGHTLEEFLDVRSSKGGEGDECGREMWSRW